MHCPYCSQVIPDEVLYCPRCGTQMGSPLPGSPFYRGPLPPGFEPPLSHKAMASLICGIFFFFLPASVAAVILGHLSLSEIRKSAGHLKGKGMATVGLVLGYLGIAAVPLILILAAIAIPNLMRSRISANESAAVTSLRTYNSSILNYAAKCPELGFPSPSRPLGPTEAACRNLAFLPKTPNQTDRTSTVRQGYLFAYTPNAPDSEGRIHGYSLWADPVAPNVSGIRHFYSDESGVIRVEQNKSAGIDSSPL